MIHSMPNLHVLARKNALGEKIYLLLVSLHISHHSSEYLVCRLGLQVRLPNRSFTLIATANQQRRGGKQ